MSPRQAPSAIESAKPTADGASRGYHCGPKTLGQANQHWTAASDGNSWGARFRVSTENCARNQGNEYLGLIDFVANVVD